MNSFLIIHPLPHTGIHIVDACIHKKYWWIISRTSHS